MQIIIILVILINELFLFRNFLTTNTFYDELFAINIAVQTNMWNVLHHLVVRRGLGPQVLDILVKALPTFVSKSSNLGQQHNISKYIFLIITIITKIYTTELTHFYVFFCFRWLVNVLK